LTLKTDFNIDGRMIRPRTPLRVGLLLSICTACTASDPEGPEPLTTDEVGPVAEQYATIVAANYADTLAAATTMSDAIDSFVQSPSEAGLEAARQAWLDARERYGQTEAFRFYAGPIDDSEGRINAWPLDEAYIDYVEGLPDAGIINDPSSYPDIDAALIDSLNENGGETNISAGWHAIEFLLWGQDLSLDGPGARPWTDYDTSGMGTAANQDRRATYLRVVTDMLVADLEAVLEQWDAAASDSYRAQLLGEAPDEIVRRMLLGMGSLAGAELAGERMEVAFATKDQEDEHSCFSDNTHRDIVTDAIGIENVYLGRYGELAGPSLYDLVAARDQALADRLADELAASVAAAEAIPAPFDRAIVDDRDTVQATIDALHAATDSIVAVAELFDITLTLE
jgi:putative iron-regulated protein